MTSLRTVLAALAVAAGCLGAAGAQASSLYVANASFETLPTGGLPNGCLGTCSFSVGAIPGWTDTGTSGQFNPAPGSNSAYYFNYIPDGNIVAYTNGGQISQIVGATAVAGATYTLTVDVGLRNDGYHSPPIEELVVNGNATPATGTFAAIGDWATFTATYTASALDAGAPIEIRLSDIFEQGDWDKVTLMSSVPEPATWAMMILGLGLVGAGLRANLVAGRRLRELEGEA